MEHNSSAGKPKITTSHLAGANFYIKQPHPPKDTSIFLYYSPKRERKVPAHLQGGDFVCESSGAQKEPQQSQVSEKRGKKSSFQLSKILPSPSKKKAGPLGEIESSNAQNESLNTPIDHTLNHQTERAEDALQDKDESGDDTSDGDLYTNYYL